MAGYRRYVVLLALTVACSKPGSVGGPRPTVNRDGSVDEAAIWRMTLAVVDAGYSKGVVSLRELSATDEDIPGCGVAAILKGRGLPHAAELVHQYLELNRTSVAVVRGDLVVLVPSGNSVADGQRLYRVSRVACVEDQCLTYVWYSCGPKCGRGTYFVLAWTEGRWTIRDEIRGCIS